MPNIAVGREKVNEFLEQNGIKKTDLATAYDMKTQEVINILNGSTKGPKANRFILRIIADYAIG